MSSESSPEDSPFSDSPNIFWEEGDPIFDPHSGNQALSAELPREISSASTSCPPPTSPVTPGISSQFSSFGFSTTSSEIVTPNRGGRPRKKGFRGVRYTHKLPKRSTVSIKRSKRSPEFETPEYGYTSGMQIPKLPIKQTVRYLLPDDSFISKSAHRPSGNRIIDMTILQDVFSSLSCSFCHSNLVLYEEAWQHGWHTKFFVKCSKCHRLQASFPSSRSLNTPRHHTVVNVPVQDRDMNEVTLRSVVAVHYTSMSWRDLHKFSTVFDLPNPLRRMPNKYLKTIETRIVEACRQSMLGSAQTLLKSESAVPSLEESAFDATVSCDASWKTRGFYSNIGFGSVISTETGKVLDFELLSRLCERCALWNTEKREKDPIQYQKWLDSHQSECYRNFEGSSQAMEPEAAWRMWSRSIYLNSLVYNVFLGDGDSKSFHRISNDSPYPLTLVRKEECRTHLTKRITRCLRKIKPSKDKKYVQHRLSQDKAEYIAANYSTVLVQNRGQSPKTISLKLYILLDHAAGNHHNCPPDPQSWCWWQFALANNIPPPAKSTNFKPQDIAKLKETFDIFASEEFCSHLTLALTQNSNECLHSMIWALIPKSKYVSPLSIRISVNLAVLIFNEGEVSMFQILKELGLDPSPLCCSELIGREKERKIKAAQQVGATVKRRKRRMRQAISSRERSLQKKEGGKSYHGGAFGSEVFVKPKPKPKSCKRKLIVSDEESLQSEDSEADISQDLLEKCAFCDSEDPELGVNRSIGSEGIDWVQCEKCRLWWHCFCAEIEYEDIQEVQFYFVPCTSLMEAETSDRH